jgi:translation elongation factor EF-G
MTTTIQGIFAADLLQTQQNVIVDSLLGCSDRNLLDRPGHQDFGEDTYRALTTVDSVAMVLNAAGAFKAQTRNLFGVRRLRDVWAT